RRAAGATARAAHDRGARRRRRHRLAGAAVSVVPRSRLREVLGFALLTAIVLELLSGLAIAFHYVPSPERAHASLMALEADYKHGRSLRAMHWIGASTAVGLTLLALLQAFFTGAYKKPGRVAWLSGVL